MRFGFRANRRETGGIRGKCCESKQSRPQPQDPGKDLLSEVMPERF
jgi:hypothetical protein